MTTFIFLSIIIFSLGLVIYANKSVNKKDVGSFLVGNRSFGIFILFFLVVGEIYSIATLIGLPGSLYAKGVNYGVWFMAFLLLSYPVAYFVAPLIWQAGKKYNSMTAPDLFKSHFKSRNLELIVAVTYLIFLIPWAQMQFGGLITVFYALGFQINSSLAVIIIGLIAYLYVSISGIKAPAYVAILKDILLFGSIIGVGWVASSKVGGMDVLFQMAKDQGASISFSSNDEVVFAMTTMFIQIFAIYCLPFYIPIIFTSKSVSGIKKANRFMPLYMLMFPFLVATAYYAMVKIPNLEEPNQAFIATALEVMPAWTIGFIAAGAALTGLILISVISLSVGGIFTRNIMPDVPLNSQKKVTQFVIIIYLIISMILTIALPNLLLNLLNMAYLGFSQMIPGMFCILFLKNINSKAVICGLIIGILTVFILYFGKINIYSINQGLIATLLNATILFLTNLIFRNNTMKGIK